MEESDAGPLSSPILAPEAALGLFPNRALSSVQVMTIIAKKGEYQHNDSAKVVRSESLGIRQRLEIASVWANSNAPVDAVTKDRSCSYKLHVTVNGVAVTGGIRIRYIRVCHIEAEPLTIAWAVPREGMFWEQSHLEKNDRNFPQRRRPHPTSNQHAVKLK